MSRTYYTDDGREIQARDPFLAVQFGGLYNHALCLRSIQAGLGFDMVAWQHRVLSTAALNWTLHEGLGTYSFSQATLPGKSPKDRAKRLGRLRNITLWYRLFCSHVGLVGCVNVEYLPPAWQVIELRRTVVFEGPGVRRQVARLHYLNRLYKWVGGCERWLWLRSPFGIQKQVARLRRVRAGWCLTTFLGSKWDQIVWNYLRSWGDS